MTFSQFVEIFLNSWGMFLKVLLKWLFHESWAGTGYADFVPPFFWHHTPTSSKSLKRETTVYGRIWILLGA